MSNDKSLVELFEENELNVSKLYKIYSEKFPDCKNFWQKLSLEEIGHANQIRTLRLRPGEDFAENNFTRGIVSYVISFVEEEIDKAKAGGVSNLDALNTALRIEHSILEKQYFDFFRPADKSLKEVMENLGRETGKHLKMLQEKVEKLERTIKK
jgi:hypothetical protein